MLLRITGTHIKFVMFAFSKLIDRWGIYRPQEEHIQLLLAICVAMHKTGSIVRNQNSTSLFFALQICT